MNSGVTISDVENTGGGMSAGADVKSNGIMADLSDDRSESNSIASKLVGSCDAVRIALDLRRWTVDRKEKRDSGPHNIFTSV